MSLARSQKLYLYSDDKVADAFQIHTGAHDVNFSYAGKPIKFNMPVQYKDGAVLVTLTDKFATVIQSVTDEKTRAQGAEMVLTSAIADEKVRAIISEVKTQGLLDAEITRSTSRTLPFESLTLRADSDEAISSTRVLVKTSMPFD